MFIEKLEFLMKRKDIKNLKILSKESDIPYTTLRGFYDKGTDGIRGSTLRKLAKFFGCTTDYLVNDSIPIDSKLGDVSSFDLEYNLNIMRNDLKILKNLDRKITEELSLNSNHSFTEEQINSWNKMPKDNTEILLNKLKELGLLSTNKELNDKELDTILKFIENNKDMLKSLIENSNK